MMYKAITPALLFLVVISSCLTSKDIGIEFKKEKDFSGKSGIYEKASFFPFKLEKPFYEAAKDELLFSAFLVLADSNFRIDIKEVKPYLIKADDTIPLKVVKAMERFSYPGLLKEEQLFLHLLYTRTKKADGSKQQIIEDITLYLHKYRFRSVH